MEHFNKNFENLSKKVLILGFIFISFFAFTIFAPKTEAAINNTINFQSKIVNKTTGLNIVTGTPACVKSGADTCDFQIRIWNDVSASSTTAGTGNLMFTQTFQDVEIGDTNGIFNLVINSCGSTTSGTSHWGTSTGTCTVVDDGGDADSDAGVNFDRQDLWIEVGFASADTSGSLGTFSELFTRTNLKSVPSAFVAQTLSGIGATGFVQFAPSSTQTTTSTNSLINLTSTATSATNPLVLVNENGTGTPNLLDLQVAGSSKFTVGNAGNLVINQLAQTSGSPSAFTINGGAHTTLTTGIEVNDVLFNLGRTVQLATGNLNNMRSVLFNAPTYSFVGASQIGRAATVSISGSPTMGTNATSVFYSAALEVVATGDTGLVLQTFSTATLSKYFNNNVQVGSVLSTGKYTVTPSTVSSGNALPTLSITAPADTGLTASSEMSDIVFNLSRTVQRAAGAVTTQRSVLIQAPTFSFVSASTITDASTVAITGAPVAGTNATITNQNALLVNTGVAAARGLVIQGAGSQTGDLLQAQNSSGTALAVISSGGGIGTTSALSVGTLIATAGTTIDFTKGVTAISGVAIGTRVAQTMTASANNDNLAGLFVGPTFTNGAFTGVLNQALYVQLSLAPQAKGLLIKAGASQTGNLLEAQSSTAGVLTTIGPTGNLTLSPAVVTTGNPTILTVTGPADTGLTATTEKIDVNFNLARTVQRATGTVATQRSVLFQAPTFSFVGASTITTASTVAITGAPVAGTNATITNQNALLVNTGVAAANGVVIQGASAQSGNLLLLQDNTATTLSFFDSTGDLSAGTTTSTAFINAGAPTTAKASLRLVASAGVNPTTPNSGDLWWNGTNLNFRTGSTTVDLLAAGGGSYVNFVSGSTQTTSSTNSLIDLTTTATGATAALIKVNENGTGTPDLLDLQVAGSSVLNVNNSGGLGIGTTASNAALSVARTYTNTSGFLAQQFNVMTLNPASASTATLISSWNQAFTGSGNTQTMSRIVGLYNQAIHQGTNTLTNATGTLTEVKVDGTGAVTTAIGGEFNAQLTGGGNVSALRNLYVNNATVSAGAITDNYGLYVVNQTSGTNDYGIYVAGADTYAIWTAAGVNRFDGNVLAGTTTNTAYLNVAAPTTSQASLRLVASAGVNPTTPNSGDLWWNGTNLNFRTASTTVDLLAGSTGFVQFANGSTQSTSSTNSLIDLTTTGNVSNALIKVNENGAGTPTLLDLQVAGSSKFKVDNGGLVTLAGNGGSTGLVLGTSSTINASTAKDLTISATNITGGSSGFVYINGGSSTTSGSGGNVTLTGGTGGTGGTGSTVDIGGGVTSGGVLTLTGGTSATSLGGASLVLNGGFSNTGGDAALKGSDAAAGKSGGDVVVRAGYGNGGTNTGSSLTLSGGSSGSTGGDLTFTAGTGSSTQGVLLFKTGATTQLTIDSTGLSQFAGPIATTISAAATSLKTGLTITQTNTNTNTNRGIYSTVTGSSTQNTGAIFDVTGTSSTNTGISGTIGGTTTDIQGAYFTLNGTGTAIAAGIRTVISTTGTSFNIGHYSSVTGTTNTKQGFNADVSGSGTTNTGIYINSVGATTNYGVFVNAGISSFADNVLFGTVTNTAFANFGAPTTAKASLRLVASAGVNPTTPNSGDLWWNGTNLNFRTASSTIDLLAGGGSCSTCVAFATGSVQTSSSLNALIDIETTGNITNPVVRINENGAGTPDLFLLMNAGSNRFQVANSGAVVITPAAGTNNPFSVSATFTGTSGSNQAFSLTPTQTVATTGSVDSFLLTPTASVAGTVAGMNGVLARVTANGGATISTARGLTSWANVGGSSAIGDLYNVSILNPSNSGTITNNYGIRIDTLTAGANDYGIYIQGADTYAIWSAAGVNRLDGRTGFGAAPNANDQVTVAGTVTSSAGGGSGLRITSTVVAAANNDTLMGLYVNPTYNGGAFSGIYRTAALINTGDVNAIGLTITGVSTQAANLVSLRDSTGTENAYITNFGRVGAEGFIGTSSQNTKILATGTTAGSGNNGSIYFMSSAGTTRGRIDTANTVANRLDGDGADGAITVSTSLNMNTSILATGRTTYADGIAYRVNPPSIGDVSVTRFRSADTISNGIAAGDDVLIANLQGSTVVAASAPSFDTASVGNYEILTVASVSASNITFTTPVKGRYVGLNALNQRVIIQRVPNYTSVTVNSGGTITASAYEGLATTPTGGVGYLTGIVAFKATGTVTVNTGGTISASSLGYRGGTAGASGANGGFNGESTNSTGANVSGRGGNGASNGETWGGGRAANGAAANPANGIQRGGGGGGGSNGSASAGADGSGAGGGGGYGGGGGGGGGGSGAVGQNGGTGGTGGSTEIAAGGGGGGSLIGAFVGGNGGNAGSAGGNAGSTGIGGSVGDGQTTGSGGGGHAATTGGGGGGGGGGTYGDQLLSNIFYGSGGGGGSGGFSTNTAGAAGGNGGGIIYIMADTISLPGTGTIQANGAAGTNGTAPASGGGGGAGGSIRLEAISSLSLGSSLVQATGGAAGTQAVRRGASGGGGVGRIFASYVTSSSGTTNPTATVAQVTNNYGTLYIGNVNTSEADLAEYYVTGDRDVEAGDVVSISPYRLANDNNEEIASQGVLRKTDVAYDSKLIGIISTSPGITMGSKDAETGQADNRALALKGRVPVKIDPDSDPISIGDYLTSSVKPGYAKKATEPGYVLGKALEYWNNTMSKKTINVFVDLGYYYGGNSSNQQAIALANSAGLSVSNYSLPSNIINIVSRATDGQVLGTNTTADNTQTENQTDNTDTSSALEKEIQLALGSSELSDYYAVSDSSINTGDVIKFDANNNLTKTTERGDTDVLGVVSTQPNIMLNGLMDSDTNRTVSMGGKVVLKVTDVNGAIKKGDYLAASAIPGYAQKADNSNGIILGRAIEDFPLSTTTDSALVTRELQKNKQQAVNMIAELVRNGKFTASDSSKYTDLINQYYSASAESNIEGHVAGRIMAYVNIGFINEGMMLPRNANVAEGTVPGSNSNADLSSDMSNLIKTIQNTKLTLNNMLTVKNVIEAQTYQNITGLDLALKIASANNSFKVLDMNDQSLLEVNQNGKLTLKEGSDSSVGQVTLAPSTPEIFIDNKSVTENSRIYVTPSEFVFTKVSSINPGVGFTIQLQNVIEKEVKVDYLIIN